MAKCQTDVCPGCSRHCSAENVRCKYGRKYFEKRQKTENGANQETVDCIYHYKWEKFVTQGGIARKLLWIGSRSKKALRRKKLTEQTLLGVLDEAEQAQMASLLEKISSNLG